MIPICDCSGHFQPTTQKDDICVKCGHYVYWKSNSANKQSDPESDFEVHINLDDLFIDD